MREKESVSCGGEREKLEKRSCGFLISCETLHIFAGFSDTRESVA